MFGAWVNAAGLAGISVPGEPHSDGRPIGVQIVAPFAHDAVALDIARRLEASDALGRPMASTGIHRLSVLLCGRQTRGKA